MRHPKNMIKYLQPVLLPGLETEQLCTGNFLFCLWLIYLKPSGNNIRILH